MQQDQIFQVGEVVKIKMANIKGHIVGINIKGLNLVEYQVSYFVGTEHKISWLCSFEVELFIDNSKPTGFGNYKEQKNIFIE
jgi:hypothetical protein